MLSSIGIAGTGFIAGCLIGTVGIGGVIIVPILVYWLDVPIQIAIASAMSGYILTGIIGTLIYTRQGSINWKLAGWICLGAAPGVILGSWTSSVIDPFFLKIGIGLLALSSALSNLLRGKGIKSSQRESLPPFALCIIGVFTGLISALTGTGGPVVLVPLLTWLRLPTLVAIGLSQAVQIPVAILGTAGSLTYGNFDLILSGLLVVTLAIGTWIGARLAHITSIANLSRLITLVTLAVGVAILLELYYSSV